jgi:hypothetical protein
VDNQGKRREQLEDNAVLRETGAGMITSTFSSKADPRRFPLAPDGGAGALEMAHKLEHIE